VSEPSDEEVIRWLAQVKIADEEPWSRERINEAIRRADGPYLKFGDPITPARAMKVSQWARHHLEAQP
jgi:hypothetical protein